MITYDILCIAMDLVVCICICICLYLFAVFLCCYRFSVNKDLRIYQICRHIFSCTVCLHCVVISQCQQPPLQSPAMTKLLPRSYENRLSKFYYQTVICRHLLIFHSILQQQLALITLIIDALFVFILIRRPTLYSVTFCSTEMKAFDWLINWLIDCVYIFVISLFCVVLKLRMSSATSYVRRILLTILFSLQF